MEDTAELTIISIGDHYVYNGGHGILNGKTIEIFKKEKIEDQKILVTYYVLDEYLNLTSLKNSFLIGSEFHGKLKLKTKG